MGFAEDEALALEALKERNAKRKAQAAGQSRSRTRVPSKLLEAKKVREAQTAALDAELESLFADESKRETPKPVTDRGAYLDSRLRKIQSLGD